jgi:hypothetical protein
MRERENNGLRIGVRLDQPVGMSLSDEHRALVRGMPNGRDQTSRRVQA